MEKNKLFSVSVQWNSFEAVLYQGILLFHQLLLFHVIDRSAYGLIGALFSLTYLIVTLINFGLDISLAPFFGKICQSKDSFKKALVIQLLPEYGIIAIAAALTLVAYPLLPAAFVARYKLNGLLILTIALLALLESTKKTARSVLHLAFLNKKTAFTEIGTLIGYTALVWGAYSFGYPLSIATVFIPMIIMSAINCLILGLHIVTFYQQLPASCPTVEPGFQIRILKNRFFNFLNQLSHMVFSSNFLVPFFAMQFGLQQAGILKLVSTLVYSVTIILQKVFGVSSSCLLSQSKESPLHYKRELFGLISNRLNQALLAIGLFFILNFKTIINWGTTIHNQQTWYLIYLFFIISFSENLFIAYEKFYITEEKADRLFVFNLIVMGLIGAILYQADAIAPLTLLIMIIAIRLLAFIALSAISFYQWQLKPSYQFDPWITAGSLVFSSLFYILT